MTYLDTIKEAQRLTTKLAEAQNQGKPIALTPEELGLIRKSLFLGRLAGYSATNCFGNPLCVEDKMAEEALDNGLGRGDLSRIYSPEEPVWLVMRASDKEGRVVNGPHTVEGADLQGVRIRISASDGEEGSILIPWSSFGSGAFFSKEKAEAWLREKEEKG